MSKIISVLDQSKSDIPITKEKRQMLYSWVHRDDPSNHSEPCNLAVFARYIRCSMREANFYATIAVCYNDGIIDIITTMHIWETGNARAYKVTVEPPNIEMSEQIYELYTHKESMIKLEKEIKTLVKHRGRILLIEDILGYQ